MTFGLFSEAEGFEFLRTRTPERFGFSLPFVGLLGRGKRCAERNDADEDLLPVDFGEKREGSLMPAHEGGRVGRFKGFGHEAGIEERNGGILFAFAPGDGFGKRILRGSAREHDADEPEPEFGHAAHEGERRAALPEKRFRVGIGRKQGLPAADFACDQLFVGRCAAEVPGGAEGFLPGSEVGADEAGGERGGFANRISRHGEPSSK